MALRPDIKKNFILRECTNCHQTFGEENFLRVNSLFYPDGHLPICNDCINKILAAGEYEWNIVNKFCQYIDIPFIPREWARFVEVNPNDAFVRYASVFAQEQYYSLDWQEYDTKYRELREAGYLEDELPLISEQKRAEQRERWGANYDDEALDYLERLYNGLINTQNVNGALQSDQAFKICKISYEIDSRIRAGTDFDKLLSSYDKLIKAAEFTPKNVKNANDFETTGEVIRWMEKRGWRNNYYDGVKRDIVDETIANIQNFNQRLYVNESGVGDEISRRIEALKMAKALEDDNYFGTNKEYDLESYDNDGFNQLFSDEDEFSVSLEEE